MTTPAERIRAVVMLAESVMSLAPYMHGSTPTVRVPRELLRQLHAWLRHYPSACEVARLDDAARYQWLRDSSHWPAVFAASDAPEPLRGSELDAAIDAVLRAQESGR